MGEIKLTENLMERLMSKIDDEYVQINIPHTDNLSFKIKTKPTNSELMHIVNKTSDTINLLSGSELRVDVKKITFYCYLLDTLSNLYIPKITEDDIVIFNYEKLQNWLNKIGFESQIKTMSYSKDNNEKDFFVSFFEMEKIINEKIDFYKQQKIHNYEWTNGISDIIAIFKNSSIGLIQTAMSFIDKLDVITKEDIMIMIDVVKKINNMKENLDTNMILEAILGFNRNQEVKNDNIQSNKFNDKAIFEQVSKEFRNIIDFKKLGYKDEADMNKFLENVKLPE